MKRQGVVFLIAGLLPAAEAPKAGTDHAKIRGTWKITAEIENGKETPPGRNEKVRFRFAADKMIVTEGDEKRESTYNLDPAKKPPTIEVTPNEGPNKGKKVNGVYQLDGDSLKLCLTLEAGKGPPTDFSARADSGRVLLTLQRVKP